VIAREHDAGGLRSVAWYSRCAGYRYRLDRTWDSARPRAAIVMLNPSTATEAADDPTVARCRTRMRALGFGAMTVVNLFAWRATDPAELRRTADPVGPGNDAAIAAACADAALVLCAWGNHGAYLGRGEAVRHRLRAEGHALHVLGVTRTGAPRHPLYLHRDAVPMPWPLPAVPDGQRGSSREFGR
jgi:hypothetical protein